MNIERRGHSFQKGYERIVRSRRDQLNEERGPDIVVDRIIVPNGVNVFFSGLKENLTISCEVPNGAFYFNQLAPDRTLFRMDYDPEAGYESFKETDLPGEVTIPAKNIGDINPSYALLHEIGHLWSTFDEEWDSRYFGAESLVSKDMLKLDIFGKGSIKLPEDPREFDKYLEAWKILGHEEQHATAIGIYLLGRLRERGRDPLPDYKSSASLANMVNVYLESHDIFNVGLQFTESQVSTFLAGYLTLPSLKDQLDNHLDQALQHQIS